jgi:uncharacterized phage infection (PIP) family protein YhgE
MFTRIIAIAMIIAAIAGLVFSVGGIVAVWMVKEPLTTSLTNTLDLVGTTVEATSSALETANQTLANAADSITALESTISTTGQTISDTSPLLEMINSILTKSLPGTIEDTRAALNTAKDSAASIESTLRLLTSIPLLPITPYNPEVPLPDALGRVSDRLEPIPQKMKDLAPTITKSQENITALSTKVDEMATSIGEIRTNVESAQSVLTQYQELLVSLESRISTAQDALPSFMTTAAWFFTIVLIWLGLTQVGLLTQGLERLKPAERPAEGTIPEPSEENPDKPAEG